MNFAKQHFTRGAGVTYWQDGERISIVRVEYGALRDVCASQACNYSYREFWF